MTDTRAPASPEPAKVIRGLSVGVAGACSVGAAGTWVSMTNEAVAAALTFPAASCCVAETVCAPSPSGEGGMHDHAPPAETVLWHSTALPCEAATPAPVLRASVTTAAGSPVPEKRMLVLLVGVGTGASVGFEIDVFTTNAFAFPEGVASSPLEKSTSTLSTCGPSASLSASAQAQFVDLIGETMQIAFPFSVTSRWKLLLMSDALTVPVRIGFASLFGDGV